MKTDEQLYFALGLAQKAGKTASGDMAVSEALKKGMGCYAVLAEDAAPRTVEKSGGSLQRDPCSFLPNVLQPQGLAKPLGRPLALLSCY